MSELRLNVKAGMVRLLVETCRIASRLKMRKQDLLMMVDQIYNEHYDSEITLVS